MEIDPQESNLKVEKDLVAAIEADLLVEVLIEEEVILLRGKEAVLPVEKEVNPLAENEVVLQVEKEVDLQVEKEAVPPVEKEARLDLLVNILSRLNLLYLKEERHRLVSHLKLKQKLKLKSVLSVIILRIDASAARNATC